MKTDHEKISTKYSFTNSVSNFNFTLMPDSILNNFTFNGGSYLDVDIELIYYEPSTINSIASSNEIPIGSEIFMSISAEYDTTYLNQFVNFNMEDANFSNNNGNLEYEWILSDWEIGIGLNNIDPYCGDGVCNDNETPEDCLKREIKEELGTDIAILEKVMTIKHTYTQFRVTLHVFNCCLNGGRLRPSACEQWKWVLPEKLNKYPFPAANVKIVKYLADEISKVNSQVNTK